MTSLGDSYLLFVDHLIQTGRKSRTIEAYNSRLYQVIQFLGPERDVIEVEPKELICFLEGFQGNRGHAGRVTLSMYIQAIKTFFQFCANMRLIELSPARGLQRPTRAKPCKERPGDLIQLASLDMPMLASKGDSLPQLVEEFILSLQANGRRPATIRIYRERLAPMCDFFVGLTPGQVTSRAMDSFVYQLRQRIAEASVSGNIQAIKAFFRFCLIRRYIEHSPADHLVRTRPQGVRKDKLIDQAGLEAMINYARENGLILEYCLLLFMADTAARSGEVQSLNRENLDLDECEAVVYGKVGERTVFFTEVTAQALRAWLDVRPATDRNAVFTTREGRISHSAIYHKLRDIAFELGITRFNPHAIRHRVGQAWVDYGANLELVRIKLGHSDVSTTALFYTHQDKSRAKAASNRYSILQGVEA